MSQKKPKEEKPKRNYLKTHNPIAIDWVEFDKLCQLQCTLQEIAGWFCCSEDTIERRVKESHQMTFKEYFNMKSSGGRISIRRKQYEVALMGDNKMLIHLGRTYLGQIEKKDIISSDGTMSPAKEINLEGLSIEELRQLKKLREKIDNNSNSETN